MAKQQSDRPLSALERAVAVATGRGDDLGSRDDPFRDRCPLLWAWLSCTAVGTEWVKVPAVLSIRLAPGGAFASLLDRDLCVAVEVASATVDGLFPALEAALGSPSPPLKSWGKREPRLRRRKSGS